MLLGYWLCSRHRSVLLFRWTAWGSTPWEQIGRRLGFLRFLRSRSLSRSFTLETGRRRSRPALPEEESTLYLNIFLNFQTVTAISGKLKFFYNLQNKPFFNEIQLQLEGGWNWYDSSGNALSIKGLNIKRLALLIWSKHWTFCQDSDSQAAEPWRVCLRAGEGRLAEEGRWTSSHQVTSLKGHFILQWK